jgi:hypothetical protein
VQKSGAVQKVTTIITQVMQIGQQVKKLDCQRSILARVPLFKAQSPAHGDTCLKSLFHATSPSRCLERHAKILASVSPLVKPRDPTFTGLRMGICRHRSSVV